MRFYWTNTAAPRVGVGVLYQKLMHSLNYPLECVSCIGIVVPIPVGRATDLAAVATPAPKDMNGKVVVVAKIAVQDGLAIIEPTVTHIRILQIDVDHVTHCLASCNSLIA
jgi:hypothetical protein